MGLDITRCELRGRPRGEHLWKRKRQRRVESFVVICSFRTGFIVQRSCDLQKLFLILRGMREFLFEPRSLSNLSSCSGLPDKLPNTSQVGCDINLNDLFILGTKRNVCVCVCVDLVSKQRVD